METIKFDGEFWEFIKHNPKFTGILVDVNGYEFRYENGKLHSETTSAIQNKQRTLRSWWLRGRRVNDDEWIMTNRINKLKRFFK